LLRAPQPAASTQISARQAAIDSGRST
jgi:hypothetical protein